MTVQQVFDMAIHIVDEQSESTGATITVDTEEYKFRTISILNAVIPRLFPYSETCSPEDILAFRTNPQGKQRGRMLDSGPKDWRRNCYLLTARNPQNPDFNQVIPLDETLCAALLPWWLAGKLMATENETLSQLCMQQYYDNFEDVKRGCPREFEPIPTPYGLF